MTQRRKRMGLYGLLQHPVIYDWKTRVLTLGRRSVRRYLAAKAALPADAKILDVGCGTGGHAGALSGRFCGIDHNAQYIRYARKRRPGCFLIMDANRLGFLADSFDLVFSVGLFHHLSEPCARIVAEEMKRVTKPGGKAWIIDGVRPTKAAPLGYILSQLDRGKHTRTIKELATLLAPEDFRLTTENIKGSFPYRRAVFSYLKTSV